MPSSFCYPAGVYRVHAIDNRKSPCRLYVMLPAWLVLAAQLFSQLHAIEHLEDADIDEQSEEVCQLCILSADLDNGSDNTRTFPHAQSKAAQLAHVQRVNPTPKSVAPYQSRAPPLLSSIV